MNRAIVIGLTGNIATGKSTVLAYLRHKGAYSIDADQLAHRTMAPDGAAYGPVVAAFGPAILRSDGQIDRSALGRIVFTDPEALRQLEAIVHPAVFALAKAEFARVEAEDMAPVVILEAIKLLESRRLITLCDEIWVVTADPDVQLQRLLQERSMNEVDARQRMAAQSPQADKMRQATRVIVNNGTLEALHVQLDLLWSQLMARRQEGNSDSQ